MLRRRRLHYFGAGLIVLLIGAVANTQMSGPGRASVRNGAPPAQMTAGGLAASGTNAFSGGGKENLDFAFYEAFLRNRSNAADGFIDDKTGRWGKGASRGAKGAAPQLQNANVVEALYGEPSGVHQGGPMGQGGGSLPATNGLLASAIFGANPLSVPGLIPGVPGTYTPPPMSEVPVPPSAILFISAIAGLAFARKQKTG